MQLYQVTAKKSLFVRRLYYTSTIRNANCENVMVCHILGILDVLIMYECKIYFFAFLLGFAALAGGFNLDPVYRLCC